MTEIPTNQRLKENGKGKGWPKHPKNQLPLMTGLDVLREKDKVAGTTEETSGEKKIEGEEIPGATND